MKIGFYGDSFCADIDAEGFQTYIQKVVDHYKAEVVNLGVKGSGVWDVIINQFPKDLSEVPDVCIFCWTNPYRFFTKTDRCLTFANFNRKEQKLANACEQYMKFLYDPEKAILENKAAMLYFDVEVLSKVNCKIVHLWSFGPNYQINDLPAVYKFKHGVDEGISLFQRR